VFSRFLDAFFSLVFFISHFEHNINCKAALETPLTQLPVSSPIKILQPGILNMGLSYQGQDDAR